ncbi:hypothetical protein BX616_005685, partial [Lobosporangium transversale]
MAMLRQGRSVREISRALHISTISVSKIFQKGEANIPRPKMGRRTKVTKRTKPLLARYFDIGKILTLRKASVSSNPLTEYRFTLRASKITLKDYVKRKKWDFTVDQIAARYQFAKDGQSTTGKT